MNPTHPRSPARWLLIGLALGCLGQSAPAGGQRPYAQLRAKAGPVSDLCFSPDGQQLASSHSDDYIRVWDASTQTLAREFRVRVPVHSGNMRLPETRQRVEALDWSPNGEFLAEGFSPGIGQGVVQTWNPKTGDSIRTLAENLSIARVVAISPDSRLVALNQRDPENNGGMIALIEADTGQTVARLRADRLAVSAVAFLPDNQRLISTAATQVHVWDIESQKLIRTFDKHKDGVTAVAVSPDGKLVATGDTRDIVILWNPDTAETTHTIEMKYALSRPKSGSREAMRQAGKDDAKRPGGVTALEFSRTGRSVLAGHVDRGIRFWSTRTGKRWDSVFGHADRVTALALNPAGDILASGGKDGVVALWKFNEPEKDPTVDEDDTGRDEPQDGK